MASSMSTSAQWDTCKLPVGEEVLHHSTMMRCARVLLGRSPQGRASTRMASRSCLILAGFIAAVGWEAADASSDLKMGTQAMLGMIGTELQMFHDDWGRFPTTREGLAILAAPGKDGAPYFAKPGFTADRWGAAFVYRCPGRTPGKSYELYSLGPNGIDEGGRGDDLDYWSDAAAVPRN